MEDKKSSNQDSPSVGLDLGLAALTAAGSNGPAVPSTGDSVAHASATEIVEKPVPIVSRLAELAEKKEWSALSTEAEVRLKVGSELDNEAKLYWVLAQLHLAQMPLSILAAPLDSATRDLTSKIPNLHLADPVLSALAARVLEEFLQNFPASPGDSVQEEFTARLAKISGDLQLNSVAKVDSSTPTFAHSASDLGILAGSAKDPAPSLKPLDDANKNNRRTLMALAATLGVVGVILFLLISGPSNTVGTLVFDSPADNFTLSPATQPQLSAAPGERVAAASQIAALYYSMKTKIEGGPTTPVEGSGSESNQQTLPSRGAPTTDGASSVAITQQQPPSVKVKPVVDTSGPPERDEFDRLYRAQRDRAALLPPTPDPLFGKPQPSFDRVAGQIDPTIAPRAHPQAEGRMPPLSDVPREGYPVELFPVGKYYTAIVQTKVMARPSYQTIALSTLQRGDRVLVEAKLGPWLRLRGVDGQSGFVFAQDCEEAQSR